MVDEVIKFLEYLRAQIAPEVLAYGASITRIESIQDLVSVLVAIMFVVVVFTSLLRPARKYSTMIEDDRPEWLTESDGFGLFLLWAGTVVSGALLLMFILMLTNVWMWVGIFNPELGFARILFERLAK